MLRMTTFLTLTLFCCAWVVAGNPELKFDNESHEFGDIQSGTAVSITFTFANDGDEPLTIEKVKTSCGCTVAKLEKRTYQPGEKGTLEVTLNAKRLLGHIQKRVHVISNDPDRPDVRLTVRAQVTRS